MSARMPPPAWWAQACARLADADPVMARLIAARADTHPVPRGDPFQTLARSIVGQQISVKAAQAVWDRFAKAAREVTPARVARMRVSTLAGAGLSQRKAEYLKDLAVRFHGGAVDPARWPALDDEAIIAELVEVRGIGRWTAEMFLIFNLLRPDVLPVDDLGVLRAIQQHYPRHLPETGAPGALPGRPVRLAAAALGERWRPWRTVATWYLWRSLEAVPVDY
jgi:DNA-3-methyladenine glycosylase II